MPLPVEPGEDLAGEDAGTIDEDVYVAEEVSTGFVIDTGVTTPDTGGAVVPGDLVPTAADAVVSNSGKSGGGCNRAGSAPSLGYLLVLILFGLVLGRLRRV